VTLTVVAVGLAAIAGIAAIQGWLPAGLSFDTAPSPAPPESLSPGESVVGGKK
jgi:hypothetical protein